MSRVIRVLKWIVWAFLVLFIVSVVVWTILNGVANVRFDAVVRELEQAGYPIDLPAIVPPDLPASENGAPYYTAAFALAARAQPSDLGALFRTAETGGIAALKPEDRPVHTGKQFCVLD